jgi:hypothetical protein
MAQHAPHEESSAGEGRTTLFLSLALFLGLLAIFLGVGHLLGSGGAEHGSAEHAAAAEHEAH